MSTVPRKRLDLLEFYESHDPVWTAVPDQIGLTPAELTALTAKRTAARSAYNAMLGARDAAKAATENFYNLADDLAAQGAMMVAAIRNEAVRQNDPNVYVLAQIPAPKTPSPVPMPGTAYAPAVGLQQGGALQLNWRCKNPAGAAGTMYEVHRQLDGGASSHIATVGQKQFTDTTLPAGTPAVTYTIVAVRSTRRGDPAQFNVQFGAASGTSSVADARVSTMRKAA